MDILIFIPARGNSKGIPGKNLVDLNGKPLIEYTLETTNELLKNQLYNWIPFISTDNDKIAAFCASRGFEMNYRRPKILAGDRSSVLDAIWDALKWLREENNIMPHYVLLLQPTSPLRDTSSIFKAITKVEEGNEFSVVSATQMREHPFECIEIKKDGWIFLRKTDKLLTGRQDYDNNYFFIDGNFYFASIEFLKNNQSFLIENETKIQVLDQFWPIDIDHKEDLIIASSFLTSREKN